MKLITKEDLREAGLTVAEAARKLGITPDHLRRALAGGRSYTERTHNALTKLINKRAQPRAVTLSASLDSPRVYAQVGRELTLAQRALLLSRMHRWLTLELTQMRNQQQADARAPHGDSIPF